MKVLVTGGLGYLGCILVKKLTDKGYSVRVLDPLLFGNKLDENSDFDLIEGDIRDHATVLRALNGIDAVVHLAGIVGEPAGNLDKELTVSVNYLATRDLAKICSRRKTRLIFSSTCSVYGAKPDKLLKEDDEVFPLSIYAISKLAAEETIENANPNSVIFRLGTLYGYSPRMRFDLVVNTFIARAIQENKITVFGGQQYRPLVHVQDAADAFLKALDSDETGVFNLGGRNCKIIDVANVIQKETRCNVVVYQEIEDPRNYAVDSSLAIQSLKVDFRRDIPYTVNRIKVAFEEGSIRDYREPVYNNTEWLRRLIK